MPFTSYVYSCLLLGQIEELGIFLHYPMAGDYLPIQKKKKKEETGGKFTLHLLAPEGSP